MSQLCFLKVTCYLLSVSFLLLKKGQQILFIAAFVDEINIDLKLFFVALIDAYLVMNITFYKEIVQIWSEFSGALNTKNYSEIKTLQSITAPSSMETKRSCSWSEAEVNQKHTSLQHDHHFSLEELLVFLLSLTQGLV